MALKKEIVLENGIVLGYHRIATINKITNNGTIIEVNSYINEQQRQKEQELITQSQETGEAVAMDVFIDTTMLNKEYLENETIKDVYKYLKTTEKFVGAEDA